MSCLQNGIFLNIALSQESTCNAELKALRKANVSRVGYRVSGIGACQCARHGLVRKNGVVNLPKGERWVVLID